MASLYKRKGSPFWWIKYRDPGSGLIKRESTGFRVGHGVDFGKARQLCAKASLRETKEASVLAGTRWEKWVPDYLTLRYGRSERTLERIQHCWRFLSLYIAEHQIFGPQQFTRDHCLAYIPWRRRNRKAEGFNEVGHNSALLDLKILSVLLTEACRRGFIEHNPCRDLGVEKVSPRPKREMTDEEIGKIRAAIAKRQSADWPYPSRHDWPHFLRVSFEIALHQGCRLSETHLDVWRDVDLDNLLIRFKAKGNRYYETALNPALVPLFRELRANGRAMTFDMPPRRTMLSLVWHKLLKKIGLGHLSFHCTRVTAISRLERAGAKADVVMQLVNHSSALVHRIYRRVNGNELRQFWPSIPAAQTGAETAHGSSATQAAADSASASHSPSSSDRRSQTPARPASKEPRQS